MDNFHHLPRDHDVVLGRGATCHIQLDDELVSREHARLEVHADGSATLCDLGSRNGTFLNSSRVLTPVRVTHGDIVRISFFDLIFEAITATRTVPATMELAYCVACAAVLTTDMTFCVGCGFKVDRERSQVCCPTCYAQVTPYMHFCTQCGHDLKAAT
ncbi:MAG: hypothetical protein ACI9WU_002280 [Myxococcota bacterium]|jgi:hypothetical protein